MNADEILVLFRSKSCEKGLLRRLQKRSLGPQMATPRAGTGSRSALLLELERILGPNLIPLTSEAVPVELVVAVFKACLYQLLAAYSRSRRSLGQIHCSIGQGVGG
jgi:hypothetical protein